MALPGHEREVAGTRIVEPACYLILPAVNEKRSQAKRHWLMWLSLLVSRESATGLSETVNGYRWKSKTAANTQCHLLYSNLGVGGDSICGLLERCFSSDFVLF